MTRSMGTISCSRPVLIAVGRIGEDLSAAQAAQALGSGLRSAGIEIDLCPLGRESDGGGDADPAPAAILQALEQARFDARMRGARAVLTAIGTLDRDALAGTVLAEVATRARQAGVPCYAVTGHDALDRFDRRILDLDSVIEAGTRSELERAGQTLATLLEGGD